jgi:HEPN domain-containing protein
MSNKTYAREWLTLAERNLETAKLLIRENHFTDIIAIELQQILEKCFKAVFALKGEKIPRTHSLLLLHDFVVQHLEIKCLSVDDLVTISDYYESERYPGPKYYLPSDAEVSYYFEIIGKVFFTISDYISNCKD